MTNEQLAEFIQQGSNDELLPLLWDKNRGIIYKKCGQYWRFYSEKLEQYGYSFDDLYQESYNALIFAVKQYKREKGYKFTSYLNYALKHVIRGLFKNGSDALNRSNTQSLEQPLGESEDDDFLLGDAIADDRAVEPFDKIERFDEYNVLYEAVDILPDDQREIIYDYYFKGLTFKRIGEMHGFTGSRARQIHNDAIRALRNGKMIAKLREIYGYSRITYTRHKGLSAFRSSRTSEVEDYVLRRWGNSQQKPPKS